MNPPTPERTKTPVFIAFVTNDDTRNIVAAIREDNPQATVEEFPAMVKIESPGRLVVKRQSVSDLMGRDWDLQEIHLNLISLSGSINETEDEFELYWGQAA